MDSCGVAKPIRFFKETQHGKLVHHNGYNPPHPAPPGHRARTPRCAGVFQGGRWGTRTLGLCRVNENPRPVRASSIGSSRVAKAHESAGQAACPDRGPTALDDPSAEAGGEFSRHFRAITAPSVGRKWRVASLLFVAGGPVLYHGTPYGTIDRSEEAFGFVLNDWDPRSARRSTSPHPRIDPAGHAHGLRGVIR